MSKAYAKHGIVNVVSPAFIATPTADAMMEKRAKRKGSSLGDAVAAAVLFLCSGRASFITGTDLGIDGGPVATM